MGGVHTVSKSRGAADVKTAMAITHAVIINKLIFKGKLEHSFIMISMSDACEQRKNSNAVCHQFLKTVKLKSLTFLH